MSSDSSNEGAARMLVVDDNLMSRKAIAYRLSQAGHSVETAASGSEALEMLQRAPAELIFLDLLMEGMSGIEVLDRLKGDPRLQAIPVVVVSGVEDAASVDACLAAGASDFLHKPVMAGTLRDIVSDLLGPRAGVAGEAAAEAAEPDSGSLPALDPGYIAQLRRDYGDETASSFIARFEDLAPG